MIVEQILNNEQEQASREAREKGLMVEEEEVILGKTWRLEIQPDHHGVGVECSQTTLEGWQGLRAGTLPR